MKYKAGGIRGIALRRIEMAKRSFQSIQAGYAVKSGEQVHRSCIYDHFKAAVYHALSIERHGIIFRLQARIAHDSLHALIPHVT